MGFDNAVGKVTQGADLTRPRLTLSWMLPAIVAAFILIAVIMIALWAFKKVKGPVMGIVAKTPVVGSVATGTAPGTESSGWIS